MQARLAKQLYRDANVPEGSCRYEELEKFQAFLGPKVTKSLWSITSPVPSFSKVTWMSTIKSFTSANMGITSMA